MGDPFTCLVQQAVDFNTWGTLFDQEPGCIDGTGAKLGDLENLIPFRLEPKLQGIGHSMSLMLIVPPLGNAMTGPAEPLLQEQSGFSILSRGTSWSATWQDCSPT